MMMMVIMMYMHVLHLQASQIVKLECHHRRLLFYDASKGTALAVAKRRHGVLAHSVMPLHLVVHEMNSPL
jgi:hypothetical protein